MLFGFSVCGVQCADNLKVRAALSVGYGAGLRASEITHLKVTDVDSERMILRVEQGKGGRDRHAMLSPQLLELLRRWYREGQLHRKMLPGGWLFPGQNPVNPVSVRQISPCPCWSISSGSPAATWLLKMVQ